MLAEAARLGQVIDQPDVDVPLPQDGEIVRPPRAPVPLAAAAPFIRPPGPLMLLRAGAAAAGAYLDLNADRAFRIRGDAAHVQRADDAVQGREDAAHIQQLDHAAELQIQVVELRARLTEVQNEEARARVAWTATWNEVEGIRENRIRGGARNLANQADLREPQARLARHQATLDAARARYRDILDQYDRAVVAENIARQAQAAFLPAPGMLAQGRNAWAGGRIAAAHPAEQNVRFLGH